MATSTLSNLSRYRGQVALVMAYNDNDCGKIFDILFSETEAKILEQTEGITVVRTAEDVIRALQATKQLVPIAVEGNSIKKIIDYIQ